MEQNTIFCQLEKIILIDEKGIFSPNYKMINYFNKLYDDEYKYYDIIFFTSKEKWEKAKVVKFLSDYRVKYNKILFGTCIDKVILITPQDETCDDNGYVFNVKNKNKELTEGQMELIEEIAL